MRLFLASQDLGNFAEVLQKMVGNKRRALVISDARDYYQDEARITQAVQKTLVNLAQIGVKAQRLDLREYFGKSEELEKLVLSEQPGLIFAIGGSVICLATALHESGMDEIIRYGVRNGDFVYGGYSAGAMVASNDLSLYELNVKPGEAVPLHRMPEITREVYRIEPYRQGLNLISGYIVPHMDHADHAEVGRERVNKIERAGAEAISLNDTDVYIVDGGKLAVMRG